MLILQIGVIDFELEHLVCEVQTVTLSLSLSLTGAIISENTHAGGRGRAREGDRGLFI